MANEKKIIELDQAAPLQGTDLIIVRQPGGTRKESLSNIQSFFGGDAHFEQSFTGVNSVAVQHNLGKRVSVMVVDSAGTEFEAQVEYDSVNPLNKILVSWNGITSGKVVCN
jgi:hypothetical protein